MILTMKSILKQLILDFHNRPLKEVKERDLSFSVDTKKIIVIIGPRRAWKSSYLFSIMNKLVASWKSINDLVYINFEDERLNLTKDDLHYIIDAYRELYPTKDVTKVYFFFDEIQNVPWWDLFIRRIHEEWHNHIFITWSNSKLLSKEIATSLRWRSIAYQLLTLSFKEYLSFKNIDSISFSSIGKALLLNYQAEYLNLWWFPELLEIPEDQKIMTLQEYFNTMLYRDVIERYNIKDSTLFKQFVKILFQSVTKEYSINKISNTLKSQGFSFDKNLIYSFVDYLEDIYFWMSISKFESSFKKQSLKKRYLFDNGFFEALSFNNYSDIWKKLENSAFIELYRRYWKHIFFLSNWSETDFVIENKEIYQVCHTLTEENRKREFQWCIDAMKKFWTKRSFLITNEQEAEYEVEGWIISVVPFYKWSLWKIE